MRSRDFIIWLDGFLHGKKQLNVDEIRYIQNKIEETNIDEQEIKRDIIIERGIPPTNPIRIQEPITDEDVDFPGKPPKIYM
jgi:hypothetical protein